MECRTYLSKVRDILNSKTLLATRVSEEELCVCWQLLEEQSSHGEGGRGGGGDGSRAPIFKNLLGTCGLSKGENT